MRTEQLKEFKTKVRIFHALVEEVVAVWSFSPHYVSISVLVQNLGADASECTNYSHESAIKKDKKIIAALHSFSQYYNSHFENWIYEEINMIYSGILMEDLEP